MAWGKTAEEKKAAAEAKDAERLAKQRAQAEAAYWTSPVGEAAQAKQRGDRFFQTAIATATLEGYSNLAWGSGDVSKTTRARGATDVLGQIEQLGWHLEHAGFVFIETGTSSRDKVMASGQRTSTSGRVEGIYLFRSIDDPNALDPTVPRIGAMPGELIDREEPTA